MESPNITESLEESNRIAMSDEEVIDTTIDIDMADVDVLVDVVVEEHNAAIEEHAAAVEGHNAAVEQNVADRALGKKPRSLRSPIWKVFMKVRDDSGEVISAKCKYCNQSYCWQKASTTTHLGRHVKNCHLVAQAARNQSRLNYQASTHKVNTLVLAPAIVEGRYDSMKMREAIAHWVLMGEHPFSIVDEEGFNNMISVAIPVWEKISRVSFKIDCVKVYEQEKESIRKMLSKVEKISLMIDLWKSKSQKIGYMVVTAHFVDSKWKLNKLVLNFVHIPPPHSGDSIADALFKCMTEWGIEKKVYTISVDNASANDSAIRVLKQLIQRNTKLLCDERLFHVRCTIHILNLIVQDGLGQIKYVIQDIRDSVAFINHSEARLRAFSSIVKQLNLPTRKLILDCKTRWNSTYEMLACAYSLREAFPMYQRQYTNYFSCPSEEDWEKVAKILDLLEVFAHVTNLISGSEYPTANLFLSEVYVVKRVLDLRVSSTDAFIQRMVVEIKRKFDKYWGECNLLMAIATILDPRVKMVAIDYCFPEIYPEVEVEKNKEKVTSVLRELYREYAAMCKRQDEAVHEASASSRSSVSTRSSASGLVKIMEHVKTVQTGVTRRTDLEVYLEDECYVCADGAGDMFDILQWWKANQSKYRVLSKIACDILAIPITTVASEATFSAGTRVIDAYRASLSIETMQALICEADWLRNNYGIKKNIGCWSQ